MPEKSGCLKKIGCLVPMIPLVTYVCGVTDGLVRYLAINEIITPRIANFLESPLAWIIPILLGSGYFSIIGKFRSELKKRKGGPGLADVFQGRAKED